MNIDQLENKHHRGGAMMLKISRIFFAALFAAGLISGGLWVDKQVRFNREARQLSQQNAGQALEGSSAFGSSGVHPVRLEIPSLNLTAPVVPVGVDANNALQIPDQSNAVGWYTGGALPGTQGSAVIDGHLDTVSGPAIFWNLHKLKSGDQIKVAMSDGTARTFLVSALKNFPQNNFPTAEVYGDPGFADLNLITCSGAYDRSISRYTDNLVVFSKLEQ